jgi:hypothetical protein
MRGLEPDAGDCFTASESTSSSSYSSPSILVYYYRCGSWEGSAPVVCYGLVSIYLALCTVRGL